MIISQVVKVVVITIGAFAMAFALTPLWYRIIKKYQVKKQIRSAEEAPVFNKFHQKKIGTPTAGGIIIWSTVVILAVLCFVMSQLFDGTWSALNFIDRRETYLPLATLIIAALIGLVDDWLGVHGFDGSKSGGLKIRHKLILYAIIAGVGAWWFYAKLELNTLTIPFYGSVSMGGWYVPVFMFIIIATAFSANETDGLDGLLGGVSLFGFVALTAVAFVTKHYHLAAFGGAVIGSLLAFLWYNIYPAKFFMGDTGSMSLGITMGVIAMLTDTALLLPFFGFILVIESLSVIAQITSKKFFKRKLFLSAPIHHHFEALGWPESQVTMRFWIISAIMSTLGIVIFFLTKL